MLLAKNTGRKKIAKNRHLRIIAQLCRASQRGMYRQSQNILLNNNISSTYSHKLVNLAY